MHRLQTVERHLTSASESSTDTKQDAFMFPSAQKILMSNVAEHDMDDTKNVITKIDVYHIDRIQDLYPKEFKPHQNIFARTKLGCNSSNEQTQYRRLINENEVVMMDIVRRESSTNTAKAFYRAGPQKIIRFRPGKVKAAIVTCGGLCPGLNDVIHEIFSTLHFNYGTDVIYGIRNGFRGFHDGDYQPWQLLTAKEVSGITQLGGTILGSSRGGFDVRKITDALELYGINQLYIIGGDGTHRAAMKINSEVMKRQMRCVVAGVPKTIDNDIGVIDRSFGFNTAVEHASEAISSALVEAKCTPNGIGIVKLMGRHSGFIASHATLASGSVDLCLIPEVEFDMETISAHVMDVLERQHYCVIVVAEGAGEHLLNESEVVDESGNTKKVESIGKYLQRELKQFLHNEGISASIKYIDPSYMIRSTRASAYDRVYCLSLAQNVVHAAMAGFTGFTVGTINNRSVLIPMSVVTSSSPCRLNPFGRTWERTLSVTHQPHFSK